MRISKRNDDVIVRKDETMKFAGEVISTHPALAKIRQGLRDMAFEDIKRAANGRAKIGAFILGACFIDYIAGYWFGADSEVKSTSSHKIFVAFTREFLKAYDPEKLYVAMRCKLVHNYSEGGAYKFAFDMPNRHLTKSENKIIINLEQFIDDIETAPNRYLQLLDTDHDVQLRAIKRWKHFGILRPSRS